MRNASKEVWSQESAPLRDGDEMCDEQLHMGKRRAGRITVELLPGGPERAGLDNKQVIQCSTGLLRKALLHVAIAPVCNHSTGMVGCAIECPKGRQFKA